MSREKKNISSERYTNAQMGKNEPERRQGWRRSIQIKKEDWKKAKLYFHVHVMHKPLEILFKHPFSLPPHPTPNTNPPIDCYCWRSFFRPVLDAIHGTYGPFWKCLRGAQ